MTDKTPHESLPIRSADDKIVYRQYFRLVVGDISAWFADHSTVNPMGIVPPETVRIISGSKFELYRGISHSWSTGLKDELVMAYEEREFRLRCMEYGLAHMADLFILYGVASIDALLEKEDASKYRYIISCKDLFRMYNSWFYYEEPQLRQMMTELQAGKDMKLGVT